MIASTLETIFKGRLCKIAKVEGLASPLEMLLNIVSKELDIMLAISHYHHLARYFWLGQRC